MPQLVATTLQRIFFRQAAARGRSNRAAASRSRDVRSSRPDFADTRPLVFRSEAFAEDLVLTHGAV